MEPTFFATQSEFRKWLDKHHGAATELLVGFYKVGSGRESMTWPESVDQALCYGWIDGVRRRIDDESYSIRFTPRKPVSVWSAINIRKVEELNKKGLMKKSGLDAFEKRTENKSRIYAYENELVELSDEFKKAFSSDKKAWAFFSAQAPSYKKTIVHWIMRAKQESTRVSRLKKAIAESGKQKRLI